MNLDNFITAYNGKKGVGNTTANKGECVGLVMVWLVDTLKQPHVWGHAMDLLKNADRTAYDVILNTPDAVPQKGDVIVWRKGFNGTFGHTAIATGTGTTNSFEVFEQNNPLGAGCRLHTYSYSFVDGWLRPKAVAEGCLLANTEENRVTFERLVANSTTYDAIKAAGFSNVETILSKITSLNEEKEALRQDYERRLDELQTKLHEFEQAQITLNNKIVDLTSAIEKDAVKDRDNLIKQLEVEEENRTLISQAKEVRVQIALEEYAPHDKVLQALADLTKPNDKAVKEHQELFQLIFEEGLGIYKRLKKNPNAVKRFFAWLKKLI